MADGPTLRARRRSRATAAEPGRRSCWCTGSELTWRSWQPVLDALGARHDVVAIDLPGFGESPPLPDGAAPTPTRLADTVESELDRLGLDAPALVGNSLGWWVALELARRGRAARAVVISPSGLESPPERALVIALNELMRLRARLGAPLGPWLTAPALARVMLFGGLRRQPWRLSPDAGVRDLHDFGSSPGFQSTLSSTVATVPRCGSARSRCRSASLTARST